MIENPDGSKRLPTKEEILENVRLQRAIRTNYNSSQATVRTNQGTVAEDRRFFSEGRGPSQQSERRNRLDESNEGSRDRTNGTAFGATGQVRGIDSSVNEYSERTTTAPTSERIYNAPIKSSKFKPYADAVKQAFKGQKKDTSQPKQSSKKLFTKQEIDASRERLVDSLLWQSDHIDEFIIGTTKGHLPVIIWSDIDRKDATVIANFILERAKTDPQMAYVAREMINLKERLQLAVIVLPRLYRTLTTYLERGIGISLR